MQMSAQIDLKLFVLIILYTTEAIIDKNDISKLLSLHENVYNIHKERFNVLKCHFSNACKVSINFFSTDEFHLS